MAAELPVEIDCRRLLADGGKLAGTIRAEQLPRIDGLYRPRGPSSASLALARDEQGKLLVSGDFRAPLEAQCQRCLEWMDVEVNGAFELDVVEAEAGIAVEHDDLVYTHGGRLAVVELVEDEILLACPMVPVHAALDCRGEGVAPSIPSQEQRHKPFAALGELLDNAPGKN